MRKAYGRTNLVSKEKGGFTLVPKKEILNKLEKLAEGGVFILEATSPEYVDLIAKLLMSVLKETDLKGVSHILYLHIASD